MEMFLGYLFAVIGIYLALGLLFYLIFIFKWAAQLDKNVQGAGIGFKLIILPGTMALWPVLFLKWKKGKKA